MTLYEELKSKGIKISSHASDLYCPCTNETVEIIKRHKHCSTRFINQVEGGVWIDVPFAYDPWWEVRR